MRSRWAGCLFVAAVCTRATFGQELIIDDSMPPTLPRPGAHQLRILTPNLLEVTLITTKQPDPAPPEQWNFVSTNGVVKLPAPAEFVVTSGGTRIAVQKVGFKRRVLYAPLRQRDLRIANELYLLLNGSVVSNAIAEVKNPSRRLWPAAVHFAAKMDNLRWSPAVHVNQLGYLPTARKKALAGFYLGSLNELQLPGQEAAPPQFGIIDSSGKMIFAGAMNLRRETGFPFRCYENVWEADFSEGTATGEKRRVVSQL